MSPTESVSSVEDDDDSLCKKKKPRTAFSRDQVAELEKKFTDKKYLSSAERGELAERQKLSDMQVKTWFQNRRMKFKRQKEEAEMELKSPKYPYGPFVPYSSIYSYVPYKPEYNGTPYGYSSSSFQSPPPSAGTEGYNYTTSPTLQSPQRFAMPNQQAMVTTPYFNPGGLTPVSPSPSSTSSSPSALMHYQPGYCNDYHNSTQVPGADWPRSLSTPPEP